jgi:hypothetical protein
LALALRNGSLNKDDNLIVSIRVFLLMLKDIDQHICKHGRIEQLKIVDDYLNKIAKAISIINIPGLPLMRIMEAINLLSVNYKLLRNTTGGQLNTSMVHRHGDGSKYLLADGPSKDAMHMLYECNVLSALISWDAQQLLLVDHHQASPLAQAIKEKNLMLVLTIFYIMPSLRNEKIQTDITLIKGYPLKLSIAEYIGRLQWHGASQLAGPKVALSEAVLITLRIDRQALEGDITKVNNGGDNLLAVAIMLNDEITVAKLVKEHPDALFTHNKQGLTPYQLAQTYGRGPVLSLVNERVRRLLLPLFVAVAKDVPDTLRMQTIKDLLKTIPAGALLVPIDGDSCYILSFALTKRLPLEVYKLLLEHGVKVSESDLATAIANAKSLPMLKLLIKHGADPFGEDSNGDVLYSTIRTMYCDDVELNSFTQLAFNMYFEKCRSNSNYLDVDVQNSYCDDVIGPAENANKAKLAAVMDLLIIDLLARYCEFKETSAANDYLVDLDKFCATDLFGTSFFSALTNQYDDLVDFNIPVAYNGSNILPLQLVIEIAPNAYDLVKLFTSKGAIVTQEMLNYADAQLERHPGLRGVLRSGKFIQLVKDGKEDETYKLLAEDALSLNLLEMAKVDLLYFTYGEAQESVFNKLKAISARFGPEKMSVLQLAMRIATNSNLIRLLVEQGASVKQADLEYADSQVDKSPGLRGLLRSREFLRLLKDGKEEEAYKLLEEDALILDLPQEAKIDLYFTLKDEESILGCLNKKNEELQRKFADKPQSEELLWFASVDLISRCRSFSCNISKFKPKDLSAVSGFEVDDTIYKFSLFNMIDFSPAINKPIRFDNTMMSPLQVAVTLAADINTLRYLVKYGAEVTNEVVEAARNNPPVYGFLRSCQLALLFEDEEYAQALTLLKNNNCLHEKERRINTSFKDAEDISYDDCIEACPNKLLQDQLKLEIMAARNLDNPQPQVPKRKRPPGINSVYSVGATSILLSGL